MTFKLIFAVFYMGVTFVSAHVCDCSEHILCLYPSKIPGPACYDLKDRGFTDEERKLVVQKMNKYRSKVALGLEKRGNPGPQPQAADMMEVTWNYYLESTAQRYADQCIFQHSAGYCRKTEEYSFGENLAWGKGYTEKTVYLGHIDAWYEEVKDFPSFLVDSYNLDRVNLPKDVQIGHYAQFLNAKTFHVGCGKTWWGTENILVCHYGPTVYWDQPLYTRGSPASMCRNGTKSSFQGLCGTESSSGSRLSCSRGIFSSYFAHLISILTLYAVATYFH